MDENTFADWFEKLRFKIPVCNTKNIKTRLIGVQQQYGTKFVMQNQKYLMMMRIF